MQEETNQKSAFDPFYWEKLSKLHPTDVCNRTEALYNPTWNGFVLPVYNLRYLILPKAKKILRMEWNDKTVEEELPPFFYLMVLVYLTEAKETKPSHTWISEKDLRGGPPSSEVLIASMLMNCKSFMEKIWTPFLRQAEDWAGAKSFMETEDSPWRYFQKSPWPIFFGKGMKNSPQGLESFSIPPSNPTFLSM